MKLETTSLVREMRKVSAQRWSKWLQVTAVGKIKSRTEVCVKVQLSGLYATITPVRIQAAFYFVYDILVFKETLHKV